MNRIDIIGQNGNDGEHYAEKEPIKVPCCADCDHLQSVGAQPDQPYPEIWCNRGRFDGVSSNDDIYLPIACDDFKVKSDE